MRTTTTATTERPARRPADRRKTGGAPMMLLPDTGCWAAPACLGCPWRECVLLMSEEERRIFRLAFRTLERFRAAPDRATA
jgi:hypothetical protein